MTFRELRLWHWRQCIAARDAEQGYKTECKQSLAYRKQADFHLNAVQTLNTFFTTQIGDTAERDDANGLYPL